MSLTNKTCVPCSSGVTQMTAVEIAPLAAQLDHWTVAHDHHIEKDFTFPNFSAALAFVNAVGAIAEAQGHHPDMTLSWGKAGVKIWTHTIDGLTESDFILASKIDAIAR